MSEYCALKKKSQSGRVKKNATAPRPRGSEGEKERERKKDRGKKLRCFVVFSILENTRLIANLRLIFVRLWHLISGGSDVKASSSNRVVSL